MNLNCEKTRELLNAYIDKLVSKEEQELIEKHLNKCNSCFSDLQLLKQTSLLLKNLEKAKLPEGFEEQIKSKIRKKYFIANLLSPTKLISFPYSKQISFVLAILLLISGLILFIKYYEKPYPGQKYVKKVSQGTSISSEKKGIRSLKEQTDILEEKSENSQHKFNQTIKKAEFDKKKTQAPIIKPGESVPNIASNPIIEFKKMKKTESTPREKRIIQAESKQEEAKEEVHMEKEYIPEISLKPKSELTVAPDKQVKKELIIPLNNSLLIKSNEIIVELYFKNGKLIKFQYIKDTGILSSNETIKEIMQKYNWGKLFPESLRQFDKYQLKFLIQKDKLILLRIL